MKPPPPCRHAPGFTLAEVLFAMAIFAFGVLVLVGTLPNGLASMQTARRHAAEARVFQHLRAVYQAELDRSLPAELNATLTRLEQPATFYFDESGDAMLSTAGNTIFLMAQSQLEPAAKLPGEADPSPFVRRLRVAVTEKWTEAAAFTDPRRHRQRLMLLSITSPVPVAPPPASEDDTSS